MKTLHAAATLAALASTALVAAPAHAGSTEGKWQIKVLGSAVLPDGKISRIDKDLIGLPAGSQTKASDNGVPTLAVEYFFTKNVSAETICCTSAHHVTGAGPLAGAAIVDHAILIPATLTLKYHLPLPGGIKPYVGVGPSLYLWLGERPGAAAASLGAARVHLSNEVGVAVQGGVDIALGKKGFGLSLDAKKYWMGTTARFYTAGGVEALTTRHKIDAWILSAGVSYRF
ncbi:OmpW family protein [Novosphingobium sp. NDB2Meth1]|uniref:OmpW/AlkL family protein n=1 Tax=Novosphingobium sp. NDB2Meth1 TaxID=1892847 RepID=UPI0009312355|nr:OmpW family outer membrane protein [Novosphingobium sp. NDB2Meth1]